MNGNKFNEELLKTLKESLDLIDEQNRINAKFKKGEGNI